MTQTMTVEPYGEVDYPSSDGEPMAETDVHRVEMLALIDALEWHFRDRADVYVAGNNFLYYEEGNPKACISPDTYVVVGVEKKRRRIYKLWEEQRAPCFVVEMSSRKTWLEDIGNKKALCAKLGVEEYFLYDPEADVVKPPLQGFRLARGGLGAERLGAEYERIEASSDGAVASRALGLTFWLDEELQLHARDTLTGATLLRPEEARADRERAQVELQRAEVERDRAAEERDALAARVRELERQLSDK